MRKETATRIVRCCHCKGMMRVAAKAISVFCPHCQKRVTLESLRVVGSHPGRTLATCGDILVEPGSLLNLEITADNVIVRGRVCGSVSANETIEVTSTGQIIGDVKARKIIVRDGGVIQGHCIMTPVNSQPGQDGAGPSRPQATSNPANVFTQPSQNDSMRSHSRAAAGPTPLEPPPRQVRPIQLD